MAIQETPYPQGLTVPTLRFVRSSKEETLDRMVMLGERALLYAIHQYLSHYYAERNHQGLANKLIAPEPERSRQSGVVVR